VGNDRAHGFLSVGVRHAMRCVDSARHGVDEGRGGVLRVAADLVGDREEPEEPIDSSVSGEGEVDEAEHTLADVGHVGASGVSRADQRREHVVAFVEACAEQLLGDGDALALVAELRTMRSK
jgi:hypothetical protein